MSSSWHVTDRLKRREVFYQQEADVYAFSEILYMQEADYALTANFRIRILLCYNIT